MRRINNDTLTFDAFRPSGGYDMRFSDAGDVEFEDLLTQEMLDALTLEHFKILYLVSKYSQFAERVTDNERWVRFQPLLVLMYECIVAGVFDYDYARIRDGVREAHLPQRHPGGPRSPGRSRGGETGSSAAHSSPRISSPWWRIRSRRRASSGCAQVR